MLAHQRLPPIGLPIAVVFTGVVQPSSSLSITFSLRLLWTLIAFSDSLAVGGLLYFIRNNILPGRLKEMSPSTAESTFDLPG